MSQGEPNPAPETFSQPAQSSSPRQQQQQQQQPKFDQPNAPAKQEAAGPTGLNQGSLVRVFTSIPGILRAFEWLFAIIMFGAMADQAGYDLLDRAKYVVAAGVLTWIYLWFIIAAHIWDLQSKYVALQWFEFFADTLLAFLDIVAGLAMAAYCNEEISGIKKCETLDKVKASIAFCFLTGFLLLGSIAFSIRRLKASSGNALISKCPC